MPGLWRLPPNHRQMTTKPRQVTTWWAVSFIQCPLMAQQWSLTRIFSTSVPDTHSCPAASMDIPSPRHRISPTTRVREKTAPWLRSASREGLRRFWLPMLSAIRGSWSRTRRGPGAAQVPALPAFPTRERSGLPGLSPAENPTFT